MRNLLCSLLFLASFTGVRVQAATPADNADRARVEVLCTRASAFVSVNIHSHRAIGTVVIEVLDEDGRTWYKEEGKALTSELVRRLDKGAFPKTRLTLKVTARDFSVARSFVVE